MTDVDLIHGETVTDIEPFFVAYASGKITFQLMFDMDDRITIPMPENNAKELIQFFERLRGQLGDKKRSYLNITSHPTVNQ